MLTGWGLMVGLSGLGATLAPARTARVVPASDTQAVLGVPYLAQSTLLCGGAAVAMVERWWGRRGVHAEEFGHLVRKAEGGIRTTDLAAATRARGWSVRVLTGTAELVRQSLADSIPVVALIEVARDRYHYVVIVGWTDATVTFHDPAVAPFAELPPTEFLARWHRADAWMMVMVPSSAPVPSPPVDRTPHPPLPCPPWLDRAAIAAAAGRLADAAALLDSAATGCPGEPLVLRERAGLRFRLGDRVGAAALARQYLDSVPSDTLAWHLLASSRYLRGDRLEALAAWNAIGRPVLDLITIVGRERIRFRVLAEASGLRLAEPLTPAGLALARRRIADVPAVASSRVDFRPVPEGMAELDVAVVEAARWPSRPRLLLGVARAVAGGVAELEVASLTGLGETWDAIWRWESANPEVAVQLDIPARPGLPGVIGVRGEWEDWHFDGTAPDLRRRAATVDFRRWWTGGVESRAAIRHERWRDDREALVLAGGIGVHDRDDRIALTAEAEQAIDLGQHDGYWRARIEAGWRSAADDDRFVVSGRLGVTAASSRTPLGLLPVAGGNAARSVPLRAHRWDRDDRLPLRRIGEAIVHGGVAADRDLAEAGPFTIGVGVFLDLARVMEAAADTDDAWYADAGVGLRLGLPGGGGSTLRVDLARGLAADPRWGVSVGLERRWPIRPRGIE